MRPAMASGGRPAYCHTTLITGMRMFGKISVGVRMIGEHAENQDEQRQHHERVRAAQGDFYDTEHCGREVLGPTIMGPRSPPQQIAIR